MTGNAKNLRDVREISSCHVSLPDGNNAVAIKEGSVVLGRNLILKDVLYMPGLTCNLIYVSELIDHSDCFVQFTNSLCVIQGRTSRMLIGAGERRDELYYFRAILSIKAMKVNGACSLNLWHKCLGHPSPQVTKLVLVINLKKSSGILNKSCDVCQRAKQTRDTFPLNDHRALDIFELIHCDLWDPYRTPSSCGASYFLTIVDDYSRGVWIVLLIDKTEVSQTLKNFFAMIARQFNKEVKIRGTGDAHGGHEHHQRGSEDAQNVQQQLVSSAEQNVADPIAQEVRSDDEGIWRSSSIVGIVENKPRFDCVIITFLTAINVDHEPTSFSEAVKDERWREAMQREIQALKNNETWEIEDLPPGKKALGCKWVYKIKYNSDGTVERNKARLVIFGNHQIEGIDYTDTFAPVAKMVTVLDSWPLQSPRSGSYIRRTFIMPSCMGISKKRLDYFLGTSPISWKTKKRHTVSRSSAEAEYRSMAMTTGELLWLKGISKSLGVSHNFAMHLSCDSQAALHIAKNPDFHE
ncbi:hypothetical protein RJ639_017625 [Escallonia herrerae]|uniref:Integrase catalytic domain-containing protein n=1 Tax=Escallonia herrerae TaxID=1293975 RepID=A0AA89AJ44_9ASTE|nr:hypothetical protein RJ639_017625 [Escallonia herrerae]